MTSLELPDSWLKDISRVIAVVNGKGGVGKTSIAANLGGLAAYNDQRTLIIDFNRQGNLGEELGYTGRSIDDAGEGLYSALRRGEPLRPAEAVRPNLDIVPGGSALEDLPALLFSRISREGRSSFLAFARCLVPLLPRYDMVFVDCPPENPALEDLILPASRWLLIPTKSDSSSVKGLREVADRFEAAEELNPTLELLGVALFATGASSRAIRREIRADITRDLGDAAPLFEATIRHVERIARDTRNSGKLVHELEEGRMAAVKNPDDTARRRDSVEGLAQDYEDLYQELVAYVAEAEAEGIAEGAEA